MDADVAIGVLVGFIFICVIILFAVLVIKIHISKIRQHAKVLYQKDIDFQKSLNTTIIETQEQVLTNISRDLHDDAGQQLTYINFQLEHLKLDSAENAIALAPVSESVERLSKSVRNISHSLNNQLLMQQDLLKAISSEVMRLRQIGAMQFDLSIVGEMAADFGVNEQIVIYRIFQEVINNILKHSDANTVSVQINTKPTFVMKISDNGKGFNYDDTPKSIGLKNLMARAQIIDYSIDLHSAPNAGTTIILSQNR